MKEWITDIEEEEDWMPMDDKELFEATHEDEYSFEGDEDFDNAVLDIDYSEFKGSFSNSLTKINKKIKKKKTKPLTQEFSVENKSTTTIAGGRKQIKKVIIPSDRQVTVEHVDEFILDDKHKQEKEIGYYKGKKLKELVLMFNNTSGVDFTLELFNPSMPLDWLQSSGGNLNDRVIVAGSNTVTYSDLLHNILANPTLIPNARFAVSGTQITEQKVQKLTFVNKAIDGESNVNPLSLALNFDLYQQQENVVAFDIIGQLNRVFIPDGMDVIQYKVLAGNSVTFCFYYKQKSLKKMMFKEARVKRMVLDEMKGIL